MTPLFIRPMDAAMVLYADGNVDLSEAIFASLSRAVCGGVHIGAAGTVQTALARLTYRILKWTASFERIFLRCWRPLFCESPFGRIGEHL